MLRLGSKHGRAAPTHGFSADQQRGLGFTDFVEHVEPAVSAGLACVLVPGVFHRSDVWPYKRIQTAPHAVHRRPSLLRWCSCRGCPLAQPAPCARMIVALEFLGPSISIAVHLVVRGQLHHRTFVDEVHGSAFVDKRKEWLGRIHHVLDTGRCLHKNLTAKTASHPATKRRHARALWELSESEWPSICPFQFISRAHNARDALLRWAANGLGVVNVFIRIDLHECPRGGFSPEIGRGYTSGAD